MKANDQDLEFGPETASDRWIDALLTEHARLGREGEDEELVFRILANTVHSGNQPSRVVARPRRSLWTGLGLGAAVAALVALLIMALSSIPGGRRSAEDLEPRFVVRILEPASPTTLPVAPTIAGQPSEVPLLAPVATSPQIPALARIEFFAPATLPGSDLATAPSLRSEDFRIRADRQQRVASGLIYEGKVLIEHKDFRIEADRVKLRSTAAAAVATDAPLFAENVRVTQASTDYVAEAGQLQYDPVHASLLLTGLTRVSTARGELASFAPDERLVLSRNGFSLESAPQRH